MCKNPRPMQYKDRQISVACRKCEDCIKARKRHWIGRLMAEQQTCHSVWFMTLTIKGGYDNEDAYRLNYADIQKMFKRLRKAGYRFKYVAVGEYGGEENRAHYHVEIFWQDRPPPAEFNRRKGYEWEYWEKGNACIEIPRSQQACAAYIMDYMNKSNLQDSIMKYSKNPMLGQSYLLLYARKHAQKGLPLFPQGATFTVPNNISKLTGKSFYYPVGEDTAIYQKMLEAYTCEWVKTRPDQRFPLSPNFEEYLNEVLEDNADWFDKPIRDYLAKHYDIKCRDVPHRLHSTYTFDEFQLNLDRYGKRWITVIHPQTGEVTWQKDLERADQGAPKKGQGYKHLTELDLLADRKQIIEKARLAYQAAKISSPRLQKIWNLSQQDANMRQLTTDPKGPKQPFGICISGKKPDRKAERSA